MKHLRSSLATAAAGTLSALLLACNPVSGAPPQQMPSFNRSTVWLNSPPLKDASLRGKVVLVQFWTYTCINWVRTLPYIRAWADKYKAHGLVVVGVHSPEFEVEKDLFNVRRAAVDLDVGYPVVIDNDFALWRAYDNHYWPALYLVDAQGRIRHYEFGEGGYERTEKVIQRLLAEAGGRGPREGLVSVHGQGVEAAADWSNLQSPETYLGFHRTENFASDGGRVFGPRRLYTAPAKLSLNHWAVSGEWAIGEQSIVLHKAGGRIVYRFHARDLHLVMGSKDGAPVRVRVTVDGKPPGAARGADVDARGNGVVTEPRLYQLIRQPKPILDRQFEIELLDPGVEAFVFTFG